MAAAVVALVLGIVHAFATPLMGLPDEPAHAVHAAAVVRGQLVGEDAVLTDPASGWTRTETTVEVPAAYAALPALPTCFAFQPEAAADCAPEVPDAAGPATSATSTVGTYAPPWYALVGWPTLVLPPTAALHAARVVAALAFAALVGMAATAAWRTGARRWGLVGLALAVPPVAVHLGGGINPSGTEIAGALALWTTTAALATGARERADLVRWVVAGVVVATVRPLGPALAVGIPVATILVLGHGGRPIPSRRPRVARAAAGVAVIATLAGAWSLWRGTLGAFSGFPAPEATGLAAVRRSLGLLPERLAEMVGVLGWADVSLPSAVVVGWLVAVVVLVGAGGWHAGLRGRAWLVALGLVVLLLPVAADVRSAPTIGFVWQGRYTLPIAAGLPILAGLLVDRRARDAGTAWAPGAVLALWGLGHVVALVAVLRRFHVGVGGDVSAAMTTSAWVLLAAAVAAVAVPALALPMGHARQHSERWSRG